MIVDSFIVARMKGGIVRSLLVSLEEKKQLYWPEKHEGPNVRAVK